MGIQATTRRGSDDTSKMGHAMVALCCLLAIGANPASADQLPAYCGAVGAKRYTPPSVTVPPVILNRGKVITVTNATMAINGDTSSVAALVANPGPDGISLQEAVIATNNDPGTWNIQFAPALKGSTIVLDPGGPGPMGLSFLSGGNVTINGDIDGDGQPDITLTSMSGTATIFISSGGNTLNGLAIESCQNCITIRGPASLGLPSAPGTTFSNITISNLVMTNVQQAAIFFCPNCGPTLTAPTGNTWDHVLITGNTITGNASGPPQGIEVQVSGGDTFQHTIIANNTIVLPSPNALGIALGTGDPLGATNQALDTLIANNVISATLLSSGIVWEGGASPTLMDGMQIIGNQITATGVESGHGIVLAVGDAPSDNQQPPQYLEGNIARNIGILANTVTGPGTGILVYAASGTTTNDAISNLSILGNTLTGGSGGGIALQAGGSVGASAPATGNSLSNVFVQANTIQITSPPGDFSLEDEINNGGIVALTGTLAPGNSVNGIAITNNDVNTPFTGIAVIGGSGFGSVIDGAPTFSADNNVVSGAQIFCNQVDRAPPASSGAKGIDVAAGLDLASGNQVQQVYVADNLVAGALGGASVSAYLGTGGSGNSLSTSSSPTPAISLVANAEGDSPLIAPNTWVEIKGVNLAPHQDALTTRIWTTPDFVNNQLPMQLDGVSATVNGMSAYVWYVSPSQVNVLTPPDAIEGPVNVCRDQRSIERTLRGAGAAALALVLRL